MMLQYRTLVEQILWFLHNFSAQRTRKTYNSHNFFKFPKHNFHNDIKRVERNSDGDTFVLFLSQYFKMNNQGDIKHHGKRAKDVLELVSAYNKWVKKTYGIRQSPISTKRLVEVFGDELDVS